MTGTAPLLLALDTGSPWVSVALARGGETVALRAAPMERSSNQVLEMMREVLIEGGARSAELHGIVALRGPGSFTGVRIGLATALGFHQSLGLQATALSTFDVLAAAAAPAPGEVLVAAVDALRGELNVQAYAAGDPPSPLGESELIPSGEVPALFDRWGAPADGRILAGFDLARIGWPAGTPTGIRLFEPRPDRPLAAVAADLAARPGFTWDPGLLVSPLYSRPPAVTLPKARTAVPVRP